MKKSLLIILCTLMSLMSWAQNRADGTAEPYAVLTDNQDIISQDSTGVTYGKTLTFYYDDQKAARNGMSVGPFGASYERAWDSDSRTSITKVIFDASFANCTSLTSTAYWFNNMSGLTVIEGISNLKTENVTNMSSMFENCSGLTSLDVSGFNTANVTDMSGMFSGCSGLTSLDVSNFKTDNVTGMNIMFSGCSGLTSLDVSGFNTTNVTNMSGMFDECSGLTSLDVSGFNTANVTGMVYMFYGCSGLTSLDVSHFKTDNVTNMWSMFQRCSGLTSLDVSGFKTDNVTNMSCMFAECYGLTSLDLSVFNTAKVTDMRWMFIFCSGLTSLDVSGFNTANVKYMEGMFYGCSGLTSLDVNNLNTSNVTDMSGMFYGCSGLTSLDVNNLNTAKVTNMSEMFSDCFGLTNLDISGFNTANVTNMSKMFSNCSGLTSLDVNNLNTANVRRMSNMFDSCSALISLDISHFDTGNVTDMRYLFNGCSSLTTIYVSSGWSTALVAQSDSMFMNCVKLVGGAGTVYNQNHVDHTYAHIDEGSQNPGYFTGKIVFFPYAVLSDNNTKLTFFYDELKDARGGMGVGPFTLSNNNVNSGWNEQRDNITNVVFDESFANCTTITSTSCWFYRFTNLTSIIGLSNLKTDNVTDMSRMFQDSPSLTSLDLSSFNTKNVTNMSRMFKDCMSLVSISFDVSHFNTANVTLINGMFDGCSSLAAIDVSRFNTSKATDMGEMFSGCSSLQTLDLRNFNTAIATRMHEMFSGCSGLTSLDVSSFNTSNVTDMGLMFGSCSSLTTIYVGEEWSTEKVTSGSRMFSNCTSLVGGAGTAYSADHTDYTYAHIDEGENNPGYFTKGGAQGPSVTVVAPEFRFEGDNLTMSTTTQNASIFYNMAELASMDEAYVDSVKNSLVVTADAIHSTYYEQPFELKKNAVVKAIAVMDGPSGMVVSDTTTMVYDYEAWMNLKAAVTSGVDLYDRAKGNPNVDAQLLEDLQWALNEGDMIYNQRAQMDSFEATHFTQRINELCAQIEAQMAAEDKPYAVLSADGLTVTFYYDTQKNARGGIDINNSYLQEDMPSPYGTAITAVFDASFANYRPTSTDFWFQNCSSLTAITNIENLNTVDVTSVRYMFFHCSSLTSLDMSKFNTANVTNMRGMFSGCSGLTSLDLSSFNTANVTDMYSMFDECSGLTSINVSSFNTTKVTYLDYMFGDCSGLTSLDLSGFNTANTTIMSGMFYGCSSLKTIYVGIEWSTNAVKESTFMFFYCTNLVGGAGTIYDENHVDHTYAHIDEGASNPGYFTRSGDSPWVDPTEKVETPYFRMESDYNNEVMIQTDTDEAEIFYTQNSRMIQGNDTDFGFGDWNLNWKVSGSNASYQVTSGGYNNSYCLKLTSATASTFGSAQAGYKFVNALTKDTYYTLRFKARSESGRGQLQVFCQNDTIDNTRSTVDTLAIGSELADYEVTFKIQNEITNQIVLNFGAVADTYYIDNVLFGAVVSDTTNQKRTRYEQPINLREGATIKAVATKQGMIESTPAVFDYFYDGWINLRDVYEMARAITNDCYGDPNVPLQMIQDVEVRVAERYSRLWDRRGREHVDDTELLETYDELRYILDELYRMKSGFTVDGVSYHAVDSTQVEVIPSLESYYRGAITVPATVNYNNINFRVTTVAQNAFRSEYLTAIFWYAGFALKATDLQSSLNPNLLLYVTEASMAPTDRDNVVINGFAKNIRLSEGGDFYCPQAFTAEAISYTREFKQQTQIGVSRGWETIALPFTVQTITHEQRGVIAPFGNTASNTHFWLRRLTSNGLQAVPTIEANTAYLISMPNSEEYIADYNLSGRVTFSAENATVPMTEVVKDESADYVMTPCFTNAAAKQGIYVLNVGEERNGYPEGSIFESNYRALLPFQAYVEHKGSNPAPPRFIISSMGGEGTTGIETIGNGQLTMDNWYDLNGRKLQGKPAMKGIYIHNGKKKIIK